VSPSQGSPPPYRFGVFEFDPRAGELRKQGMKLKLQGQPLDILAMLLERPGEVVTREDLQKRLWASDTIVEFDHSLNAAIKRLRDALDDSAETPRYVETLARRGYRLIAPVLPKAAPAAAPSALRSKVMLAGAVTVLILGLGVSGWLFYVHHAHALSATDTVVLGDFTNKTDDAVFGDALRQGLAVQLEQSPFLGLVSQERIQQTLRLMGQPADAKLTPEIARDLCQRTGSKAYIGGSIAGLGKEYVIGLNAVNCATGDSLAQEQVQAAAKERVLDALDRAAAKLREKLGESLSTVQKFDTPLEQATTPSLEALQAYSLGWGSAHAGDMAGAVPRFQRAIRLDPNFAMAYASLGTGYRNLGEISLAAENWRKAYELRQRVSERERFYIESHFYGGITGNLEKARQTYELWAQTYPRDHVPPGNLATVYSVLGQYEKAVVKAQEARRLDPTDLGLLAHLASCYLYLNRLEEARATAQEAQAKKFDSLYLRQFLYQVAFLQNDAAGMAQQVAWATGKPGAEDVLLAYEADTAAYSGRVGQAREFSRRAGDSAKQAEEKETAASYQAKAGLREALFGNATEARDQEEAALAFSTGRDVQYLAALALAIAGQITRAQALADELAKRFPEGTVVQFNYLPVLRARIALSRNDSSKAIGVLQAAAPYELGLPTGTGNLLVLKALYPAYVRGEAYLAASQGSEAAVEFQKILDHRSIVGNEPIGALAHLGLARAFAVQGDKTRARAAYQDFFTLWKDADPDIPILKRAKAEYANLS
jgi:DNA-binding winged helix-turn-helix (wHTH) protein/Flp pilus assembly protein TadD